MKSITPALVATGMLLATSLAFLHAAPATKTVHITANDTLHYNVSRIEASPGQALHIVLENNGTVPKVAMAHNWILLTANESPDAYAAAAISAQASSYQPADLKSDVLASIPLLGPGESAEVTFNAPTSPGTYAYLCSFPAHCGAGMRGVLVVK